MAAAAHWQLTVVDSRPKVGAEPHDINDFRQPFATCCKFDGALLGESRLSARSQDIVDPCGIGPEEIYHNDLIHTFSC